MEASFPVHGGQEKYSVQQEKTSKNTIARLLLKLFV
jgi:hypothetical protein